MVFMTTQFDAVYSTAGGVPLAFDLFHPGTSNSVPLVICVHGGGWISGDRSGMHEVAQNLVKAGFAALCPTYRLAPLHPFPAAVEDAQACVAYAKEHAAELGINENRVATLGNSAGGHLAAMAGLSGPTPADLVIDICGISDVTDPRSRHFPVSWAFLEQFMQANYETEPEKFEQASPLKHVSASSPPFLLIHGEEDDIVPVQQSIDMAHALNRVGVHNVLITLPRESHTFTYEAWEQIEDHYIRFLKNHLL